MIVDILGTEYIVTRNTSAIEGMGSDVNVAVLIVFTSYGDLKLLMSMISSKRERVTLRMILKRSVEFLYCKRRTLIDTPLYVSM